MFHKRSFFQQRAQRQASALVITLAALVLISAILLVFFDQSTLNRAISFSSAGQYRADLVAHTGLETIAGDLRTEMVAGSTTYTTNGFNIYIPTINLTVAPCRVADQGFPNLVKQSSSSAPFWAGANYDPAVTVPSRSASGNSTQTASGNDRAIKINRWNQPGLLADPGSGTIAALTATYTPPDWVIVAREGATSNAATLPAVGPGSGTLSDATAANLNYAVGRYAYTIYDEGGLLDVNVAGFPNSLQGTDFTTKRGLMPQVDVGALLTQSVINDPKATADANALVAWRNQATGMSASSYTNYVFTATNGFTTVAPGDQSFVSRKDLINFVKTDSTIPTAALQYMGTFTRELNAPSYTPNPGRPKVQSGNIAYGRDDEYNPSLINLRVTTSFQRNSDGTTAQVGEPLIKYRFPLSRLNWIGNAGANGATQIYNSFGLKWQSVTDQWSGSTTMAWVYNHGDPNGILSLADVAAGTTDTADGPREPDFFELLKAGISVGSLGKQAAAATSDLTILDSVPGYQIIQIGANLIDQYDADSYPTHIQFGNPVVDFYGVENLPYLTQVYETPYRFHGPSQQPYCEQAGIWYQPVVWNPHAQANTPPPGPTQFRFINSGSAQSEFIDETNPREWALKSSTQPVNFADSAGITFSVTGANTFSAPTLLSPAMGAVASGNDLVTDEGLTDFVGICAGVDSFPDVRLADPSATHAWTGCLAIPVTGDTTTTVTNELQYKNEAGAWVTYDVIRNIFTGEGCNDALTPNCFQNYLPRTFMIRSDPRTDRFGCLGGAYQPNYAINETVRPSTAMGYEAHSNLTPQSLMTTGAGAGWSFSGPEVYPPTLSAYLGYLSENMASLNTYYSDPDGVVRPGDGAYANGMAADGGYPLATDIYNNPSSRPMILNRPFRSVADMGYASRGMPWKELDFFNSQSADSALLDLFCVTEPAVPPSTATSFPVPEAGRVDLNTHQQPVIAAILAGAIKSDADNTTITAAEAGTMATSLTSLTANAAQGPLVNRSELVTRFAPLISYPNAPDSIIKRRREAAIRALADVGTTRTWNLLIDIIAQSGRYPSSATSLNQFIVEGERRYWLHVAIDRYTGKIVQQYLEPVYE
jgi:hypothetical protein